MKVKKNKLPVWAFSILFIVVILFIVILFLFAKYNVGFTEGEVFLKNGLSINPASLNKLEEYNTKVKSDIDILHYNIHIELFPKKEIIVGDVLIKGVIKNKNIKNISLNFYDNFEIASVKFNKMNVSYEYNDDKLVIPYKPSKKDTFYIQVKYKGEPESLGFGSFNFEEYEGSKVIYTLNEPIYASTWFPCNDTPNDKVLTDLSITNDSSMISVSNGVLVNVTTSHGKRTFHWKTKYPIATYLISIYSAEYINFSDKYISSGNDTLNIEYYVFPNQLKEAKKDFEIHPQAIKYFTELFGEYPFMKEKYGVAEFMWKLGAMEHQSITGIGKNFITGRNFFTGMLVHELAHQWWGDAVTIKTWKDIWLNEGFATYAEALYWEKESGFNSLKSTMNSYLTNFKKYKLYNPEETFGKIVYNKGAWVLHMLRREVGDDIFFKILKSYYKKFKYKNVSTYDFINIAEEISKKDLTRFFNQWVFEGEGKLEIEYRFQNIKIKNKQYVVIKINQIQSGYNTYQFPLDIDIILEDGKKIKHKVYITANKTEIEYPMPNKVKKIILDNNNWLAAEIKLIK